MDLALEKKRLARARRWVFGGVLANTFLALVLGAAVYRAQPRVSARYDPGFPADLLVVHNEGGRLDRARLVLDGAWSHRLDALPEGTRTFDLRRLFESPGGARPPASYVPRRLRIEHEGGALEFDVMGAEVSP